MQCLVNTVRVVGTPSQPKPISIGFFKETCARALLKWKPTPLRLSFHQLLLFVDNNANATSLDSTSDSVGGVCNTQCPSSSTKYKTLTSLDADRLFVFSKSSFA